MAGRNPLDLVSVSRAGEPANAKPALIDAHCHCLPGVDDGPATLEKSLALCRTLGAEGVDRVVATPHQLGRYEQTNDPAMIRQATAKLNAALAGANLPLTVYPGAEVRIHEQLERFLEQGVVTTLADTGACLLLELPRRVQIDPRPLIETVRSKGIAVVISHPERLSAITDEPEIAGLWQEAGAWLQVTAASLVGGFGAAAHRVGWRLVEAGFANLVASDAHHALHRPPRMRAAYEALHTRLGTDTAWRLCHAHAARLLAAKHADTECPGPRRKASGNLP